MAVTYMYRYENALYGFSIGLPISWFVNTHNNDIILSNGEIYVVITFSKLEPNEFVEVIQKEFEKLSAFLQIPLEIKKLNGNRLLLRHPLSLILIQKCPTNPFIPFARHGYLTLVDVLKRKGGSLAVAISAPESYFEDAFEVANEILSTFRLDVERMPFRREILRYGTVPAVEVCVPEDARVEVYPTTMQNIPVLFYDVIWEDQRVGYRAISYSQQRSFLGVVCQISGIPVPQPPAFDLESFFKYALPYYWSNFEGIYELRDLKYVESPEVFRELHSAYIGAMTGFNQSPMMGFSQPQQMDVGRFFADYGSRKLMGSFIINEVSIMGFSTSMIYTEFNVIDGNDFRVLYTVSSTRKTLPEFYRLQENALARNMLNMIRERNRIIQREMRSIVRHCREMREITQATFSDINDNIMDSFYADLNQSYEETIKLSDALSGHVRLYDDYGNTYLTENIADEYFINEVGDTILAVDQDVLYEIEDELRFEGWKRLKKYD